MNGISILIAALSVVLWSGCSSSRGGQTPKEEAILIIVGTMHYREIEGGCWQFRSDAGESFELIGKLADQLRLDGRRARLRIRPRPELSSICMVGMIAEVVAILDLY